MIHAPCYTRKPEPNWSVPVFATAVLVFFGLSFGVFGAWALVAPVSLAKLVHFSLETPGAITEIRAFYGGLEIGLAALLLAGAAYRPLMPVALLALVIGAGGIALARVVGLLLDGSSSGFMFGALTWEVAGAVLGLVAYLKLDTA